MRKLIACVAAVLLLPGCATAQRSDDAQARNRCRLALQIVETGHPEPHSVWAYERVAFCGSEAGAAVASAMLRNRENRDTVQLDLVTSPAANLRDGRILVAALEIAADRAASAEARVYAFRTLIQTLAPGTVLRFADLTEPSGPGRGCFGLGPHLHLETVDGAPLPADYAGRIREVALEVASDPDSPRAVARAGTCAALHVRSAM